MRFEIREENMEKKISEHSSQPLRYRISLTFFEPNIFALTREYFQMGFLDGEKDDDFYIAYSGDDVIDYISFITQNLNENYLKEKEEEILKIGFDHLIGSKKNIKSNLKEKIREYKKLNQDITETLNLDVFKKLNRKLKLKKIENETNNLV